MRIIVTYRNREEKIIQDFELEDILNQVTRINSNEIDGILNKLEKGSIMGFNDVHFKKYD